MASIDSIKIIVSVIRAYCRYAGMETVVHVHVFVNMCMCVHYGSAASVGHYLRLLEAMLITCRAPLVLKTKHLTKIITSTYINVDTPFNQDT